MKRDLDLIRYILLTTEQSDKGVTDSVLVNQCYDIRTIAFHTELLIDRGLVSGSVEYDGFHTTPLGVEITRITWEGYDYLDSIRSDKVWRKAKEVISKSVGDTSLLVVKDTCQLVAKTLIKQNIGS